MSMSDEQFEKAVSMSEWCDDLRARDVTQREALARAEAERDALREQVVKSDAVAMANHFACDTAQAQLAEAVGLLWFIQGYLEEGQDSNVKSKIRNFISRHRLDEHTQAEQQEATPCRSCNDQPDQDHPGTCSTCHKNGWDQDAQGAQAGDRTEVSDAYWRGWNDRAALATQPEVPEQYEYWCIAFGRWRPIQELVEFLTSRGFKVRAVRGAEHA